MLAEIVENDISDKRWNVRLSLMSHTPMTKDAAKGLQREIGELEKEFKRIVRSMKKHPFDKNAPLESKYTIELEPGDDFGDLLEGT